MSPCCRPDPDPGESAEIRQAREHEEIEKGLRMLFGENRPDWL